MSSSVRNMAVICSAAALRSFGIGLTGVVLGVFLYREGHSSGFIGLMIAIGLAGSAAATAAVTFMADRLGRRRTFFILSLLTAGGALPLIFNGGSLLLMLGAFLGMLNGMGTDRSAPFALEQAVIPSLVSDQKRTWSFAWYSLVLDGGGALGALAAGAPVVLERWWQVDVGVAYRWLFSGYAALNLLSGLVYLLLTPQVEIGVGRQAREKRTISPEGRTTVRKLASLFALDSLGGGLLTDALVSYWFFRRFGIAENRLALLFFAVHVLNALSHLGAAWLARRIGLIRTMVFTHLPSSIFLMAASLVPSSRWAVAFFLLREALVEMDVPTRQSYVAAVVAPTERTFAAGVTNLTRNLCWAVSSSFAGALMKVSFSAPLFAGGSLKVIYDLLLWRAFRHVRPPEERAEAKTS